MTTPLHKQIVEKLVSEQGLQRAGFSQALRKATKGTEIWDVYVERHKFFPSAFRIDARRKEILVYEVELTGAITEYKMANLAGLWDCCDYWGWTFKVLVATSSKTQGGQYVLHEVSLQDRFYGHLVTLAEGLRERKPVHGLAGVAAPGVVAILDLRVGDSS